MPRASDRACRNRSAARAVDRPIRRSDLVVIPMARETIERPRAQPSWRARQSVLSDAFVIAIIGLVSLMIVTTIDPQPDRLDHLTVSNPTEYELFVEVRGNQPGWMPLAIVSPRTDARLASPIDPGGTWTLRFHSQGETSETIDVRRADVQARDWRLEVPDVVAEQLRAAGAPASPPR